MITIIFIMKVMTIKNNKYINNRNNNTTTTNIYGNKTIIRHTINIF